MPKTKPLIVPRIVAALYWVALVIGTHARGVRLPDTREPVLPADKIAHGVAFALLMALVLWARPFGARLSAYLNRLIALVAVVAYAAVDETTQGWFGRQGDVADFLADCIGIVSVYLIAAAPTGLTRWPTWLVNAARAVWLAVVPAAVMLAVTPQAGQLLHRVFMQQGWRHGVDKAGHFVLAMVATWLFAVTCPGTRGKPKLSVAIVLLFSIVSAPAIELIQKELGRGMRPDQMDAAAHMRGLAVALGVWVGLSLVAPLWNRWLDKRGVPRHGRHRKARDVTEAIRSTRFVGHAAFISVLTLASRLTGLVRDAALAAVFGMAAVADAFLFGFLIPNLFRRLFGEGALTAAFIPNYTDLLKRDPRLARRFASLCVTLLVLLLSAITIAGQLTLHWLLAAGEWDERWSLSLRLASVMLPYMPMVCVVALLGGVLQVHRKFGPPAAAPILLNLTMIAFTVWAAAGLDVGRAETQREVAYIVAGAVLVAGLIQAGYLMISVQRVAGLTYRFHGAGPALKRMLRMMVPMALGLAAFQINALLDALIAMWLSPGEAGGQPAEPILGMFETYPMRTGDLAALQWSQRLYQFPLGVFGIAIATAIFPALAAAVRSDTGTGAAQPTDDFRDILRRGLRLTVFIGLPAGVGLVMVCTPLTRVVYERGEFTPQDAGRVAEILTCYALSIWAYSMTHLLTRAFYAIKDTMTPVKVSLAMVVVNLGMNLVLVWDFGARGLALSTAISAAIQSGVLLLILSRRVPRPVDRTVLAGWGRTAVMTAIMGAALWPAVYFLDLPALSWSSSAGVLAAMVAGGAGVALVAALLLGCEELRWVRRR